MSAHAQVIEWSNGQPHWRRDALRRFLTGAFGPADESEILELLKAEHKLTDSALKAKPLLAEHIPAPGSGTDRVTLHALSNVTNANRLAPDQTLSFAPTGITLIYGDNGSGKSGYARILKKACRARLVETILNNVFDAKAPKGSAQATFTLAVGKGQATTPILWEDGKPGPSELARIAVFDNKCAAVYVDQENQVTFIPYNLDCFERLAGLCDRLKDRLAGEQTKLKLATLKPVLALPEGTSSYIFLNTLATKTDAELGTATTWSKADEARVLELAALVTDPEKRALALRQLQAQLKAVRTIIVDALPHLSEAGVAALVAKKNAMVVAREAAELAATTAFTNEPLERIGTPPWRALYEAARAYSEQAAYPDKSFPVVEADARCVLCQQPLGDDAQARLKRFDQFVEGELNKAADTAAKAWEEAIANFRTATSKVVPLAPALDKMLAAESAAIRDSVASYLLEAVALRNQIETAVISEAKEPLGKIPIMSVSDLDAFLGTLESTATATEAAVKDKTAINLRRELAELQARSQLHVNKEQVKKRLDELRTIGQLEIAIKACVTTGISQKGTELLKEHVTGEFEVALRDECKILGIEGIPLRLNSRSPKGSPSHQLKLDQTSFAGNTSAILSEGEHRALALASFLAEQKTVPGEAPIIVDDPVSSLDHDRRHRVAHRLIDEAKIRQVIVFTHDLLFYMDASFIAAEKQVPLTKIGIRRGPNGFGTIDPDGDPWTAKVLGKRRSWLEQQHAKLKKLREQNNGEEYEKEATFFYSRLRETWERLIEEGLFANVIVRYRRSVETKRLAEAVVDDATVARIYHGMTAISEYTGHDKPVAAGTTWPDPDTMKGHLDDLIACIGLVQTESGAARKRREKSEKSPTPILATGTVQKSHQAI